MNGTEILPCPFCGGPAGTSIFDEVFSMTGPTPAQEAALQALADFGQEFELYEDKTRWIAPSLIIFEVHTKETW